MNFVWKIDEIKLPCLDFDGGGDGGLQQKHEHTF